MGSRRVTNLANMFFSYSVVSVQELCQTIFSVLFHPKNPRHELNLTQMQLLRESSNVIRPDWPAKTLYHAGVEAVKAYSSQHVVSRLLRFINEGGNQSDEQSLMAVASLIQVFQQVEDLHKAFIARDVYVSLVELFWKWIRDVGQPDIVFMVITHILMCLWK